MKQEFWHKITVSAPSPAAEAVQFAFDRLHSLGTETKQLSNDDAGPVTITAYFSKPPDETVVTDEIEYALRVYGIESGGIGGFEYEIIPDQDWLAEWKKHWRPVEIGRFVIAAPWHDVEEIDKTVIRIEPNMAFGTGTHETTRLCLDAISNSYRSDQSFLDVGTGTGILAIAAAKIADGDTKVAAVDTDPDAVAIARLNAVENRVGERIEIETGTIDRIDGRFDFVCANLTADVIVGLLPAMLNATNEVLVLSGILAEQEAWVAESLPADLHHEIARDGEWIAIVVRKG